MKIKPDQIRQFARELEIKFPGINFAYLFGSASMGTISASSDIDIAVFLKDRDEKIKMLPDIIGEAEKIFPGRQRVLSTMGSLKINSELSRKSSKISVVGTSGLLSS